MPKEIRFENCFHKHRTKLEGETEKRPVYRQCYKARQVEFHSAKAE